jgi:hypothetical protein
MRRLVLISALLLASASAYAGESRDLVLASSDAPSTDIPRPLPPIKKSSNTPKEQTAEPARPLAAKSLGGKSFDAKSLDAKSFDAKSLGSKSLASRSALPVSASRYGSRETQARRIAARYGIHW